ncbi:hypothetical protein LSH36_8g14047 [Paralvinella palmiformis]|uniref:Uncharacterized protein n=1 Tax=Paralvinella palmiformis TaxID=53620 RepID=A0AAD9KEC4_9ANNE|nr:hypothetical protein LSH36_8g14047 [Paralvinella palmiformis]
MYRPAAYWTKKVQVKVESSIDDDVDILPVHLDGWKNASKADKSRIAAKWRRDREVEYLDKLSALLPFPIDVTSKLDKGSILRLTITYLQLKNDVCRITGESRPQVFSQVTHVIDQHKTDHTYSHSNSKRDSGNMNQMLKVNEPELMLHALGGFLLYINRKGRILYVSENVNTHLGFHQYDMIGKKVLAFIHHDDHKELTKQFMISMPPSMSLPTTDEVDENEDEDPDSINPDTFVSQRPAFYLRMRYQIMKKGSKTKHTGYLLSQWSGRIRLAPSKSNPGHSSIVGMVTICRPLQSTSLLEIRLDGNMFMSRHTLDLKFTFCDPRFSLTAILAALMLVISE